MSIEPCVDSSVGPNCVRAIFTHILEFRARVLVISTATSGYRRTVLIIGGSFTSLNPEGCGNSYACCA